MAIFGDYAAVAFISERLRNVKYGIYMLSDVSRRIGTEGGKLSYTSKVRRRCFSYAKTDKSLEAIEVGGIHCRLSLRLGMKIRGTEYR